MKAIIRSKYGPPSVLRIGSIEKPIPGEDEMLVRVHATTVNRTDCGILLGKPFIIRFFTGLFKPKLLITGIDFAGKVVAVGKKIKSFQVGDRIWGLNDEGMGSHAEYIKVKENQALAKIPDNMAYDQIVACGEGAHYAYNFLKKLAIAPGMKVLLNGATGAIGVAALQLLKYHGLIVTAVGNTENIRLLKSLGADEVIDYRKENFTDHDGKYHFVFDAVGKSSFFECRHLLLPKGAYLSSEFGPYYQNLYLPLITKLLRGRQAFFPIPTNSKKSILFMTKLAEEGKFKPVIDKKYPLEDVKSAYEYVLTGEKTGNLVLKF